MSCPDFSGEWERCIFALWRRRAGAVSFVAGSRKLHGVAARGRDCPGRVFGSSTRAGLIPPLAVFVSTTRAANFFDAIVIPIASFLRAVRAQEQDSSLKPDAGVVSLYPPFCGKGVAVCDSLKGAATASHEGGRRRSLLRFVKGLMQVSDGIPSLAGFQW